MRKRTVGILGLTGDPTHDGHVHGGESALVNLGLDEVWFMPSPQSTAKVGQEKLPIEHRLHLAHLALLQSGRLGTTFKVSDLEVSFYKLTGKNATADVLQHFTEMYESLQPVWLMGADNLCQIHEWGPHWQEVMTRYPVGILSRDGWTEKALVSPAAKLFAAGRRDPKKFRAEPGTWSHIDVDHSASATEIRTELQTGQKPRHLCLEAYEYIKANGLYRRPVLSVQ